MQSIINQNYQLKDSIHAPSGRIFLTGNQALVRMLLSQAKRDKEANLNTAGFVSGYRGSPLGGVDTAMWHHSKALDAANIQFQPAINEDLAASMLMGTQQIEGQAKKSVDSVFGMWYGKGPGVDRAGDALHHGHAAGASPNGGVLVVVGDDHVGVSSSIPHGSEQALRHFRMPIIHPSSVEEYEYFGLWGWALSRYSGAWVGFKAITETVESGRAVDILEVPRFNEDLPPSTSAHGYDASGFLTPHVEKRIENRLRAVHEFARHHPLDRLVEAAPEAKVGIITSGKSTLDAQDAIAALHAEEQSLPVLRHYKVGLVWPMVPDTLLAFAEGLDHILIIEEKGDFIEAQVRNLLFHLENRPTVCGKSNQANQELIPSLGQLSPSIVQKALRHWLRLPAQKTPPTVVKELSTFGLSRKPYFCSGCPHSSSTKVPEGSQALAGVGCHYMAAWMDRDTDGISPMGAEGTSWVGASPFMDKAHIFQNMGEGTYFHSGYLAIRQAVAAQTNITYKILFNDAVAMTGGQPVDGSLTVPNICQQVLGEGVQKVVITTDEPERYKTISLPAGIEVLHRRELDRIQRELRDIKGVTVLIHDQTCAAEKRRMRKKNAYPNPKRRIFINPEICEGCGDCGVQSNCLSIVPLETELGRKRAIDQSSCNKDYSCVEGFCPSFVSVLGAEPKKAGGIDSEKLAEHLHSAIQALPQSPPQNLATANNLIVAGIGGTGVITIGAIVAMAAHLEGRAASVLDMTGLAQKGGTVISHVRLGADDQALGAVRIDHQQADTAILCDSVAASNPAAAQCINPHNTQVFINNYLAPTAEFTRDADVALPNEAFVEQIVQRSGSENTHTVNAHYVAEQLFGDSILSNMLMLGMAWQQGTIPLHWASIERAISLNGVSVKENLLAFEAGRLWIANPDSIKQLIQKTEPTMAQRPETLADAMALYQSRLINYQNIRYAETFISTIKELHLAEQQLYPDTEALSLEAAHSLYKLMAYKDEYEVARLYHSSAFKEQLAQQFEGDFTLNFHMAPPWISQMGSNGRPLKRQLGSWMQQVFPLLSKAKALRGTPLDVFGYQSERKMERKLRDDFIEALSQISQNLNAENYSTQLEYVRLPQKIRGFGPVKEQAMAQFANSASALHSAQ